jgi:hypothetical protein
MHATDSRNNRKSSFKGQDQCDGGCRALAGGYYWFPNPNGDSVIWQVVTCHDLNCDADVGHVDLWTMVIDRLATAWRRDERVLKNHLRNNYTGLPRGRVTKVRDGFMLFHGKDAPVEHWIPMVVRKFDLKARSVKVVFDEHEQMIPEDRMKVSRVLGIKVRRGANNEVR